MCFLNKLRLTDIVKTVPGVDPKRVFSFETLIQPPTNAPELSATQTNAGGFIIVAVWYKLIS